MFDRPDPKPDFAALETAMLRLWAEHDVFKKSVRGDKEHVFYDGPPFATGRPHYGHLLAGTLKDIVPRYWTMRGYKVERRFGWDTHGLPVEMEIEKQLKLNGPSDIHAYGIDRYNEACRSIVLRYTELWRETVTRMGRWVDFDNDYKTMDPTFMESVWWVFNALWDKGLIYHGHKVMPYSWRLGTPLSNFEANMDYRKVQDPAVTVTFPLVDAEKTAFLGWTTTPWTLPSNMALCVGPTLRYAKVTVAGDDTTYIVALDRVPAVFGDAAEIVSEHDGTEFVGLRYKPCFDFFADLAEEGAFVVLSDDYVTADDGTGVVHQAPAYGEDDYRICRAAGLPLVDPVDDEGCFDAQVPIGEGRFVKDADKDLVRDLKARGRLFAQATIDHDYPFCWRSGTPLIYKAIGTWFVRVTAIRDQMVANNKQTTWVPAYVGERRFGNWLEDARDWAISRNRFWGTPLPVWECDACDERVSIGAIADLEALAGCPVPDLHKHHVDKLTWGCAACDGTMRRVTEVLDCWFESGSMPYAQNHYPFENKELVEGNLPADFIAEGLDQTRGWFYTLLILSTALFDRPAFKNVIVNGLILAEDGTKMSKSLQNYPDPSHVIDKYGADALRAYLINSPVVRAEPMRFSEAGVRDVVRSVMLPLYNAYSFFAMYASVDKWQPPQSPSQMSERPLIDRWIVSMAQSLVGDVNTRMEQYRLYEVIPAVLGFIDHLTNWYIRRSRRRFWKSDDVADKQLAFETLYGVLCTFSRLLAPILPFIADELYQRLEVGQRPGALESVHLERFPEVQPALIDRDVESAMHLARDVVSLGRKVREQNKLPIRQPLAKLNVALGTPHPLFVDGSEYFDYVRAELNIKTIRTVADASELAEVRVKPNFRVLGKRLGKQMKVVAGALAKLSDEARAPLLAGGSVTVEGHEIGADDIIVSLFARGDGAVASSADTMVWLDTQLTDDLRAEYAAREIISRLQKGRKDAGFAVEQRIEAFLFTDSSELAAAIATHTETIAAETLADALHVADKAQEHAVKAAGHSFSFSLVESAQARC
jgi:isoleucyl-tRNA synthetase